MPAAPIRGIELGAGAGGMVGCWGGVREIVGGCRLFSLDIGRLEPPLPLGRLERSPTLPAALPPNSEPGLFTCSCCMVATRDAVD